MANFPRTVSACLDSSLLVYSWGWVGGIFAAPLGFLPGALPQGLQRALLSLLQVPLGFSGHRVSVLLPW